jgi:hypothetical protein
MTDNHLLVLRPFAVIARAHLLLRLERLRNAFLLEMADCAGPALLNPYGRVRDSPGIGLRLRG